MTDIHRCHSCKQNHHIMVGISMLESQVYECTDCHTLRQNCTTCGAKTNTVGGHCSCVSCTQKFFTTKQCHSCMSDRYNIQSGVCWKCTLKYNNIDDLEYWVSAKYPTLPPTVVSKVMSCINKTS